jgi:Flp pilus assembly protein TadB
MEPMRPIDEEAYTGSSASTSWRWWLSFLAMGLLGLVLASVLSGLLWGLAVVVIVVFSGALDWWRHRARNHSVD